MLATILIRVEITDMGHREVMVAVLMDLTLVVKIRAGLKHQNAPHFYHPLVMEMEEAAEAILAMGMESVWSL